jgi:DNA-binding response OmpR family regulator
LLRIKGHDVQVLFEGQCVVEKAASFRPQVAILDLGLPGLSG